MSVRGFARELRRRKVWQVGAAYSSAGIAVALAAAELWDDLGLPWWTPRLVLLLLVLGLPIALVLAWAYELRPEEPQDAETSGARQREVSARGEDVARTTADVSAETSERSIVVLPFENMSPEATDAYLADGLAEEITADLAGIRALRVISRTSAFQYRGTSKDTRTIARELSVRYILEGSVRKVGDDLRITAQLIDAHADAHLWAGKYAGTMVEVFDLQERVARSIMETLAVRLSPEEERALATHAISDLRAFELYLRARRGIWSVTREGLEEAQRALEQAVALERDNPVLLSQLAHLHYEFWNFGVRIDEGDLRLAREYAEEMLRLAPGAADSHFIQGMLEVTGGDVVRALGHLDEALAIDPAHPDALAAHPALTSFMGLEEAARVKLRELARIDPLSALNWSLPIWIEITTGRFEAAVREARRVRSARPPDLMIELGYGYALGLSGSGAGAASVLRRVHEENDHLIARTFAALGCALDGGRESALALVDAGLERWARKDMAYSLWVAETLAVLGESDRALDWLENAVGHGNINYPFIAEYDPFLASLRGTERFGRIAERARAGWERWHAEHPSSGVAAGAARPQPVRT